jgi:hypothetical protein
MSLIAGTCPAEGFCQPPAQTGIIFLALRRESGNNGNLKRGIAALEQAAFEMSGKKMLGAMETRRMCC